MTPAPVAVARNISTVAGSKAISGSHTSLANQDNLKECVELCVSKVVAFFILLETTNLRSAALQLIQ
jgi:hypothetical protein